jgi:hypothetical protein|nr:MAG TPA: hypothetical protein [Caudoviricetes sp.]
MPRSINELAADLCQTERPVGVILSDVSVKGLLIAAVRFYAGYANLTESGEERTEVEDINEETTLTLSEWSIIRPLYLLYVERETALQLEATRVMGADPFGRSSSEIAAEIQQVEGEMANKAYVEPYLTV